MVWLTKGASSRRERREISGVIESERYSRESRATLVALFVSVVTIPWGKSRRFPGRNPVGALSFASSRESNRVIRFVAGSCVGRGECPWPRVFSSCYFGSRDLFARVSRKLSRVARNSKWRSCSSTEVGASEKPADKILSVRARLRVSKYISVERNLIDTWMGIY